MNFLNRADMFFAQKLYNEALDEVGKVLNLDSTNEEAKLIKRRIAELRFQQETRVQELVKKLKEAEESNDFDSAIQICDALKEDDASNFTKWTAKIERIKTHRKELEENERRLTALKEDINNAHFDEDWTRLKLLCESYLSISSDNLVSQFLIKAKRRLEDIRVREAKEKALATINQLILDRRMNEAEQELNRFAQNYPSEHSVVKDLRKKIFSFGDASTPVVEDLPRRKPIGFNSPKSEPQEKDDDFFGIQSNPRRARQAQQPKREKSVAPKKTDDFFDGTVIQIGDHTNKKTTNDDFNF